MSFVEFYFIYKMNSQQVVAPAWMKIIDAVDLVSKELHLQKKEIKSYFIGNEQINPNLSINYYFTDIREANGVITIQDNRPLSGWVFEIEERYDAAHLHNLADLITRAAYKKEKTEKRQQEFDDELNESASK